MAAMTMRASRIYAQLLLAMILKANGEIRVARKKPLVEESTDLSSEYEDEDSDLSEPLAAFSASDSEEEESERVVRRRVRRKKRNHHKPSTYS